MIVALIVFLLVIIFLAFFIGKNLSNTCNFWFFNGFENVPVSVLVLLAFGVGIVFCILVFIIAKIKKAAYSDSDPAEAKRERAQRKAEKAARAEQAEKEKSEKLKEKIQKKERKLRKDKNSVSNVPANSDNK